MSLRRPPVIAARCAAGLGFTVLAMLWPLSAMATWACANESGKMSFQDRPCDAKAPSTQWEAVKASELTTAGALETLRRFDNAVKERDMASAGRLLAKNFKSVRLSKQGRSEMTAAEYMDSVTRMVQSSKRYQSERACNEGRAEALSQTLRLECRKLERVEVMRRSSSTEKAERVRLVLEGGEIRIAEISDLPPQPADAQASAPKS
ncbi:hypothetical protein ACVNIS_12950 [Sphaerotilaceae bacterium SBD11-9]